MAVNAYCTIQRKCLFQVFAYSLGICVHELNNKVRTPLICLHYVIFTLEYGHCQRKKRSPHDTEQLFLVKRMCVCNTKSNKGEHLPYKNIMKWTVNFNVTVIVLQCRCVNAARRAPRGRPSSVWLSMSTQKAEPKRGC